MKRIMKTALSLFMVICMLCTTVLFVSAEDYNTNIDALPILTEGTSDYALDTAYKYTIFAFEPTEIGKYTVSSTDSKVGIVSYTGMWVSTEPTADTVAENEVVWDCTDVGQTIWVAVDSDSDASTANITIEKEEIIIIEPELVVYENQTTPVAFTFTLSEEELLYVDTFDTTVDSAVLGKDGYYHLNSEEGPVLFADLNDSLMSLVDAQSYGQLTEIIYEGETPITKIDYYNAFDAYMQCADSATMLYPLTIDLITIYQRVGAYRAWYGSDGWVGGNAEDAWMFACYYDPAYVGEHVHDYAVETQDATCILDGSKTYTCAGCGDTYTEVILAPGHVDEDADDVCDVCGESPRTIPGDINGDGTINSKDLTRLMRLLAGEDVFVTNPNVNGDEKVDVKDLTRLMKAFAGEDVELH